MGACPGDEVGNQGEGPTIANLPTNRGGIKIRGGKS